MKLIDVLLQFVSSLPHSISEIERQIGFTTTTGKPNTMLRNSIQYPEKHKISNKHIPVLLAFCLKNGMKLYAKQLSWQYEVGEEASLTIDIELWKDSQSIKTHQVVFDASELLYRQDFQLNAPNPITETEGEILNCDKTKGGGYVIEVLVSKPYEISQKIKIQG